MLTVYGIKNCNTMKKTFDFLTQNNIAYHFFDYKKQLLSHEDFHRFISHFGIEKVINKQGTTYKKLSDDQKSIIAHGDIHAIYELIKDYQSILKRPIITGDYHDKPIWLIGFNEEDYERLFK